MKTHLAIYAFDLMRKPLKRKTTSPSKHLDTILKGIHKYFGPYKQEWIQIVSKYANIP